MATKGVAGLLENIGSGWGRAHLLPAFQRKAGFLGEGAGSKQMSGNGAHVQSHETDVRGIAARQNGVVARCVSVADTSLSLSLSLQLAF